MAFKRSAVRSRLSPPFLAENVEMALESFDSKAIFVPNTFQMIALNDAPPLSCPTPPFFCERRTNPQFGTAFGIHLERADFSVWNQFKKRKKLLLFPVFTEKT